ncbi:MAG: tetratricopeptide repeat protein, partial [Bdellovibrionales bacterium]|nr:tetratricopeptide repeat protein [Bdellovibrionales bacterium]
KGESIHKNKIQSDRQKALKIYAAVDDKLPNSEKGKVLLQEAYLYSLTSNENKSISIYQDIIKKRKYHRPDIVALAYVQLGDIYFYRGEFKKALYNFDESLKIDKNPRKAYSYYRSAWSDFNLGDSQKAQRKLIKLLSDDSFSGSKVPTSASFKDDASRDLATFMAKNGIKTSDLQLLANLSPEGSKRKNLVYLASELDRTGKKQSALIVWKKLGTKDLSFEDQLEGQIKITRIQYDLGNKKNLIKELNTSISMLKNSPCPDNTECAIGQQNLKKILADWGKSEEREPSTELIFAFKVFSESFSDYEMSFWAAQASMKRKDYQQAFEGFRNAALILSKLNPTKDPKKDKIFNNSLLNAIESAERSNSKELKLVSYKLYLDLNPTGKNFYLVKYQMAHWYYDYNKYP